MDTIEFDTTYYDVWSDGEGGWTANCMVVNRKTITVPADASDRVVEMAARAAHGFTGRRTVRDCDDCITRWVDPANAVAVELSWGH